MKIALISIYGVDNLGPRHLHSVLTRSGHDVHLIFLKEAFFDDFCPPSQKEYKVLIGLLKQLKPDVIGVSVGAFMFAEIALRLILEIKSWFPGPVILGGVYPTLFPERCIHFSDIVCVGAGEEAFLELLDNIESGKAIDHIKNLWVRGKTGQITKNHIRDINGVLEYSPYLGDQNKYFIEDDRVSYIDPLRVRAFRYHTQVTCGCPFACSFCSETAFKKLYAGKSTMRKRSVQNIIAELINAKKELPDISMIVFSNEIFPSQKEWVRDFAREYKRHVDLPFWCLFNPICIDGQQLGLLKDAGMAFVNMGVQSGSERIRKEVFNRPETLRDVIGGVSECWEKGIIPTLDFIVDNPYEDKQDKISTLKLIYTLKRPFDVRLFSFVYMPRSVLADTALSEGRIKAEEIERAFTLPASSDSILANISKKRSREELVYICLMAIASKCLLPEKPAIFLLNYKLSTKFPLFQLLVFFTMFSGWVYFFTRWLKFSQKRSMIKYIKKLPYYIKYVFTIIK